MKNQFLKALSIGLAFIMLLSSFGMLKNNIQKNYTQRDFRKSEIQFAVVDENLDYLNKKLGCYASMSDFETPYYIGDFIFDGKKYEVILSNEHGQYVYSLFSHLKDKSVKSFVEKITEQKNRNQTQNQSNAGKNNISVIVLYLTQNQDFKVYLSAFKMIYVPFLEKSSKDFISSIFIPPCVGKLNG
jgi:hypothetical protein